METRNAIVVFEEVPVRREWHNGEQWIPAIDVAKALEYDNPSRAVKDILKRNEARFEGYTTRCKLHVVEGGIEKGRMTDWLNLYGVIAFCMISSMPKAIPFQRWADKELAKRIQEIPTDIRLISKQKRVKFTDSLKEHGCTKPYHYINITRDMKEGLNIDRNKPKDSCDLIEVMKISVSEELARINLIQNHANRYTECRDESVKASVLINEGTKLKLDKQTTKV
jgi:prophage antirepressor-like protein